jgi:hypothetical protein
MLAFQPLWQRKIGLENANNRGESMKRLVYGRDAMAAVQCRAD